MKKLTSILFTLLLLFVSNIRGQDYYNTLHTFNKMLKTNKDLSSYRTFIDTTTYLFPDMYTTLLKLNKATQDSDLVAECFKRLVLSGYDENYYNGFLNEYMDIKQRQWKKYRPIFEKGLDTVLVRKIKEMDEKDQYVRRNDVSLEIMVKTDSINQVELKKIITDLGKIPGIKELGYTTLYDLMILFRHLDCNKDFFYFIYPKIIQQTKQGEFFPEQVASMIDYYWWGCEFIQKDKTKGFSYQLYGTIQLKTNDGRMIKVPVKDWEETEKLRHELGLPSLKEELDNNPKIIYDLELFKEKFPAFQE
ncbi:MAG: hypothetical protein H6Q16_2039 [Bacteroidetes bacterium]|nr:hypothetical protein [Bacteroidota bacterium]